MEIKGQPEQKVSETLSQKNELGMVAQVRRSQSKASSNKKAESCPKNKNKLVKTFVTSQCTPSTTIIKKVFK
jgi:hypothetical protein